MGAAPSIFLKSSSTTSFVDLSRDIFIHEILPQLDLASAVSLSFTNKELNGIIVFSTLQSKFDPLKSRVAQIVSNSIELRYSSLSAFLLDFFSHHIRFFDDINLAEIIASAFKANNGHLAESILKQFKRRLPHIGTCYRGLGASGNVDLIIQTLRIYNICMSDNILNDLVYGAMPKADKSVLELVLSKDKNQARTIFILSAFHGTFSIKPL